MSGTGTAPGSGSGRHASQPSSGGGRRTAALVVGAVVVVALVAAAVTGWPVSMPWSGGGSTPAASQSSPSASGGAASPAPSQAPSSGADSTGDGATASGWLKTCAAKVAGEEKVVAAAADGVRDWHAHVQARTDMFAGRISQDQMHQIWTRTRLAGPDEQKRFTAAADQHPAHSACSKPADVPAGSRTAVTDCRERSKAAARAVEAAHAAMGDWDTHLTNMATYADGQMSATMAQDRWVASWRNAPTNIDAYQAARTALKQAPVCSAQAG